MSDAPADGGQVVASRIGPVMTLRLDRPRYRNALGFSLRTQLTDAIAAAETDDGIRAVVLGGSDTCFSAGGDIREFGSEAAWTVRPGDPGTVWAALASRKKARGTRCARMTVRAVKATATTPG